MFLFHEVVEAVLGPKVLKQCGYQHENARRYRGDCLTGIPHEQEIPAPVTTTIRLLFVTANDKFRSALLTDASLAPASNGNVWGMVEVWSTTVEPAGGGEVMWRGRSSNPLPPSNDLDRPRTFLKRATSRHVGVIRTSYLNFQNGPPTTRVWRTRRDCGNNIRRVHTGYQA